MMQRDVTLIALFAAMVFLFLCNFMSLGIVGTFFSNAMFGLFGVVAYVLPVFVFGLYLYYILMVENDPDIEIKIVAILSLFLIASVAAELISGNLASQTGYDPAAIYTRCAEGRSGGGIIGGSIAFVLYQLLKMFGSVLVLIVATAACVYALAQQSILELARDKAMDARLHHLERREEEERYREEHPEEFEDDGYGDAWEEDEQVPSHYEESRQRYQELQRERKERLRRQNAEKKAREEERRNAESMWNTDLSADSAFAADSNLSADWNDAANAAGSAANGQDDGLQGGVENPAGQSAAAAAAGAVGRKVHDLDSADDGHFDTDVSPAETQKHTEEMSEPSEQLSEEQTPPTVIDPIEAILAHRRAQEEERLRQEEERRQEEAAARLQEQTEREARRNSLNMHEIYPEDYLDDESILEPVKRVEDADHDTEDNRHSDTIYRNDSGENLSRDSHTDFNESYRTNELTKEDLEERILSGGVSQAKVPAALGAAAGAQTACTAASAATAQAVPAAADSIPEIYEEVPGIRVVKSATDIYAKTAADIPAETNIKAAAETITEPENEAGVPEQTASSSENRMDEFSDSWSMPDESAKRNVNQTAETEQAAASKEPEDEMGIPYSAPGGSNSGIAPAADEPVDVTIHTEREAGSSEINTALSESSDDSDSASNFSAANGGSRESMSEHASALGTAAAPQSVPSGAADAPEVKVVKREYIFPPMDLLKKGAGSQADHDEELRSTAQLLQTTLRNFGVNITITDISQGPSVTRYEMLPEMGVKVSKIVSLADDIKLALAATDIRIEAPIPGKSAIGIEVPNKEASPVALRDIVDTEEFRSQKSKLAFAVGKDIAGKPVYGDIAKMPHVLIAGATGSGKSVCINTIIMSLLYHAKPEEVKLIMIDPKVVELSVYNNIPHLMIPVVTNPQKAAAALNWGVAEMEARYRAFADARVRDIKGYNALVKQHQEQGPQGEGEAVMHFMPQLVIIVDELADLMMVAKNDVETAICRLAQLARAAGIHLIIATQRPSVDVITGLIKANMPSRIAFRVSSGVDSRTILDMNGAEKLLGKGDMLFFPQGLPKPNRVQGCFVSDEEVTDVVNFLIENNPVSDEETRRHQQEIDSMEAGNGGGSSAGGMDSGSSAPVSDVDELFGSAGAFIIDKNNASIGLLQRRYRIGFNRAARIMDQLCDKGVVGEAAGTKSRAILMTMEQFASFCNDNGYEIGPE